MTIIYRRTRHRQWEKRSQEDEAWTRKYIGDTTWRMNYEIGWKGCYLERNGKLAGEITIRNDVFWILRTEAPRKDLSTNFWD
jgi:hypothetical protein